MFTEIRLWADLVLEFVAYEAYRCASGYGVRCCYSCAGANGRFVPSEE